jgi:hypothetical protein
MSAALLIIMPLALRTKFENWDHEGAAPIPLDEWMTILRFADQVLKANKQAGEPHFSACGNGSTHARWYSGSRWVEAEQLSGRFGVTFSEIVDGYRYHDAASEGDAVRLVTNFLVR